MPTIALISDPRRQSDAQKLRDRLLVAWPVPGGDPKVVLTLPHDSPARLPAADACIVLDPSLLGDGHASDIARACRAAHVPLVLLAPERDERFRATETYAMRPDTDAGVLAGMLGGMASRTHEVRSMEESLRYAQSVHESVSRLVEQFQDDQLLAASIQRQFVAQELPVVDSMTCAALFRPIDFLSGDIYRVTRLDEHHVGFLLADAMGHGLPAALMSLYIAGRVMQKEVTGSSYRIVPPAESMARLNRDLVQTGCANVRFATAVSGTFDLRTREVRLAAAGHPHPVILGPSATRKVEVGGALLGVMEDSEYPEAMVTLDPGEAIFLFSDGLEDSLNPRRPGEESDGSPRNRHITFLEEVAAQIGEPDPARMFARFTEMMDAESGSMHQIDDVTLVGLRAVA